MREMWAQKSGAHVAVGMPTPRVWLHPGRAESHAPSVAQAGCLGTLAQVAAWGWRVQC